MWKHADKPCYNSECSEHDDDKKSCMLYTTIKEQYKTIQERSHAWKCLHPDERLMSLVSIEPYTRCWLWRGKFTGVIPYYPDYEKGEMSAARAMYRLIVGEVPKNKKIFRTCGTRHCVNPHHMEVK